MRVLKVISGYPPLYVAGSEIYSQTLCEALAARGHEVDVFTGAQDPYRPDFEVEMTQEAERLRVHRVNLPRGRDVVRQEGVDAALIELVERARPDVAHVGHLFYLSMGIVGALADLGVPVVFTLHDFWLMCPRGQFLQTNYGQRPFHQLCDGQDDRKCALRCFNSHFTGEPDTFERDLEYWTGHVGRRMEAARRVVERVGRFIAPSRHLRERFIEGFGVDEARIELLNYGFEAARLGLPPERPGGPMRFGYIGTHSPSKGIDLLIEAFAGVTAPAELLIFGHPRYQSTASLEAMARRCPNPVRFMGGYDHRRIVEEVFAHVDCVVVPSIWVENSPLVIHEAQGCRVPVITADVGGMAEHVEHEVNGLRFVHRDAGSLRQQLDRAARDLALMRRLGRRGHLHHPDGDIPGIGEHCDRIEAIYRALVEA